MNGLDDTGILDRLAWHERGVSISEPHDQVLRIPEGGQHREFCRVGSTVDRLYPDADVFG